MMVLIGLTSSAKHVSEKDHIQREVSNTDFHDLPMSFENLAVWGKGGMPRMYNDYGVLSIHQYL